MGKESVLVHDYIKLQISRK